MGCALASALLSLINDADGMDAPGRTELGARSAIEHLPAGCDGGFPLPPGHRGSPLATVVSNNEKLSWSS